MIRVGGRRPRRGARRPGAAGLRGRRTWRWSAPPGRREALALVSRVRPDVVLMDLQMPGVDGVRPPGRSSRGHPAAVVVLTSFSDGERIVAALDAGAVGYLLKDAEPDDDLDGIRAAARGESPLDPRAARELLPRGRRPPGARSQLTPREIEVLGWCGRGWPTSRSHVASGSPSAP